MKLLLFFLTALLLMNVVSAEDTLSIGNVTIEEGKSVVVAVTISNSSWDYGFFATQWDNQVINFTEVDCGTYACAVTVNNCSTVKFVVEDGRGGSDTCAVSMITTTYIGSDADDAGDFIFGHVRITAIGNAGDSTDLNIFDAHIVSDAGDPILCRYVDGSVTISPLLGDANTDRIVDVRDAILLLNHIANPDIVVSEIRSDVNSDNKIDVLDVVLLLRIVAGVL